MTGRATIELAKEDMHFSAGHFTVFSATERENLHGHDFFVRATFSGPVDEGGLCFDYGVAKRILRELCDSLDETTLLPSRSPHLVIEAGADAITVDFGDERLTFLARDAQLLPVRNVTVEELARWLLGELRSHAEFRLLPVDSVQLSVSSGPGQWGGASWQAETPA